MSRFYDALKEASRTRLSDPKGSSAFENIASRMPEENRDRERHESLVALTAVAPAGIHSEEIAPEAALTPAEPSAVAVHTHLDHKAPVLPHIADSVVLEHYRRLRTKLLQEQELRPFRTLMVASPTPEDGKTVTAFNLALSFSMLPYCKVLLIDGDLRKGSLGKWLGVEGPPGFSNLVEGTASIEDVVLKSEELPFHFVLKGSSKLSAAELLNAPALKSRMQQMTEGYDFVVVDSPPLMLVTDAQLLAGCCDASLLVIRAFSTTRKAFEQAVHELQPFRVVGTVLNGGTQVAKYRRYNQYY